MLALQWPLNATPLLLCHKRVCNCIYHISDRERERQKELTLSVDPELARLKEAIEEILRYEPAVDLSQLPAMLQEMMVTLPKDKKLKNVLRDFPEVCRCLSVYCLSHSINPSLFLSLYLSLLFSLPFFNHFYQIELPLRYRAYGMLT